MSESYIIRHEQCPECKKLGRDNSKDNLGVYSDGHRYCYSCGYYLPGSEINKYKTKYAPTAPSKQIVLPYDTSTTIRPDALEWFLSYGFDENTIKRNTIMWSESREMLLFPYIIEGDLLGWQGRLFGEEKAKRKWFTQGNVDEIIYLVGRPSKQVVLVESIISAIKVGRIALSCPILGSHISNRRLLRLSKFYDTIVIWLDPDKRKESLEIAKRVQLFGMTPKIVYTDKKPKDYTTQQIQEYLE